MSKNLLIVESPAKAKTIEKFLGPDFKVVSSYGHIRDLDKGNNAIDIADNYMPKYIVPKDKEKLVKELKKEAKASETVWLATDEDREGEAISWHLCEVLGLSPKTTKRIVFHEITESAIKGAVANPRTLDQNLVNAQQARRVLDRLVGFELSPILWKKISQGSSLSAGRVQSVAVRIIVEREREILTFNSQSSYKVSAEFDVADASGKKVALKAELPRRLADEKEAQAFLESCKGAKFDIKDIQTKPASKSPAPPFTTSTLQQEASRKMSYSVTRTMSVAQKLYEAGHITYMRTDSVNLSDLALASAAEAISNDYGKEYSQTRKYKSKNASAQEAHEAIRPTYFNKKEIKGSAEEQRLYELIWKRAVASQMSDAKLERTTVKIGVSTIDDQLSAKGEVLLFPGFLKLYIESTDDEGDEEVSGMLPPLTAGQNLPLRFMEAKERFSQAPPRYNEASLVKKLEELGIGRPSTYAPTITTIQKRNYVEKADRDGTPRNYQLLVLADGTIATQTQTENTGVERAKLFPTDIGKVVNDFLTEHFEKVMDYNFTAKIEEEFDDIADGKIEWNKMIDSFYVPFHKTVEDTNENADRASGERELGVDPKSGKVLLVRIGRYGPMAQIGKADDADEVKPRFAKLQGGQQIDSITLEEALELFKFPKTLGSYEDEEVAVAIGRFGPYVRHGKVFASIPKAIDPVDLDLDGAIELIEKKREADANKYINTFKDGTIEVLNGRYGPYIKVGKTNYKIPKDTDAKLLTEADCEEIIKNTAPSGAKKKRAPKK